MSNYLIVCRSLTYAQRTTAILEHAGITSHMIRTPKSIPGRGCGYSVRIRHNVLEDALAVLRKKGLAPYAVYTQGEMGGYEEVVM